MSRRIKVSSFGYAKSGPPKDALSVIDCRALPNPHNVAELRHLTGKDNAVKDFLLKNARTHEVLGAALSRAEGFDSVALGCHGGRHRSVALAEMVTDRLRDAGYEVELDHAEL